jgi:hypothetical protein
VRRCRLNEGTFGPSFSPHSDLLRRHVELMMKNDTRLEWCMMAHVVLIVMVAAIYAGFMR